MNRIIFILCCGLFALQSFAQNRIEAITDKNNVGVFERFNYQIVTNTGRCKVQQPDFDGLEIIGGRPSQSTFNSTQIINGVRTQTVEYRWTYQLRAKSKGTFTISEPALNCDGEITTGNKVTITVGEKSQEDNDFFMRLIANKSSVYEGEPFKITLKYYAKERPSSFEALDLGDAIGIYRQDLNPKQTSFQTNIENYQGKRYYTIILREELCYAQRSGEVRLEPYYASLVFSRGFFQQYRKETYSNALSIDVKRIPNSSNPDFNGLVGDFTLSSELSSNHVKMGDAIDLSITIEGKGNLQDIGQVKLDIPQEFNQFEPEIEEKLTPSSSGLKGKIKYNFVLIPKHYGTYEIPPFSFLYFDLDKKQMQRASTDAFTIKVDKREGMDIETPTPIEEKSDIRYIEEEAGSYFNTGDFLFGSYTYYLLLLAPLGIALLFIIRKRKKENLSDADQQKIEHKKAVKVALTTLKKIKETSSNELTKEDLKTIHQTLIHYLKTKWNLGLSDLSKNEIEKRLINTQVNDETVQLFNRVWSTIESAQYAPMASANIKHTAEETEQLIKELDHVI